jgi:hypothetical protein
MKEGATGMAMTRLFAGGMDRSYIHMVRFSNPFGGCC